MKKNIRNTIIALGKESITCMMSQEGLEYWMSGSDNEVIEVTSKTIILRQDCREPRFNVITIID